MVLQIFILLTSLAILLFSADRLIEVIVRFARGLGIPTMVVGLTVVAVGTSLPEVMASGAAALLGHPEIAVGNVVGSNVCNIGLILGLPALFFSIDCSRTVILRQGGLMMAATLLFWLIAATLGEIGRVTAGVFVLGFCAFIYSVFRDSSSMADEIGQGEEELEESQSASESLAASIIKIVLLLACLLLSSDFLVEATIAIARSFGISEAVIAISVIALGTSLPELSVSIAAAKKNEGDILVGNVLGSNISNILLVLGVTGLITPFQISGVTLLFDIPLMVLLSTMMMIFLYQRKGITMPRGCFLLLLYAGVILRCVLAPDAV